MQDLTRALYEINYYFSVSLSKIYTIYCILKYLPFLRFTAYIFIQSTSITKSTSNFFFLNTNFTLILVQKFLLDFVSQVNDLQDNFAQL